MPRGHYICEECEAELAAAELTPAQETRKGFFGRAKRPPEPAIVSEEDEPEPTPLWRVLLRGVRTAAFAVVVMGVFVFGWNVCHSQARAPAIETPPFFQHMQSRTREIVSELTNALSH